jgi:ribosome biogenesis GTPase / thiamine phosphate phosphatase
MVPSDPLIELPPSEAALAGWGWTAARSAAFGPQRAAGLLPGRVVLESNGHYEVWLAAGPTSATLAGRLRHSAPTSAELPAVGDWVSVAPPAATGAGSVIAEVLPRSSRIARQSSSELLTERVLAANVDAMLVVQALGRDVNARRLERYLALAWSSGVEPVVVLNKVDLHPDPASQLDEIRSAALGAPIHLVSARTGQGLDALRAELRPGRTVALLGSSGVGKSTLVNVLLQDERQITAEVRSDDERGRHTTVARTLIAVPGGGLLLDTPGLRSVALWDAEEGVDAAYADIGQLAADCRFRDCRHEREPGCAVRMAIESGELPAERLAARRKLERELAAQARRTDPAERAEQRRRGRAIQRAVRAHEAARRWSEGS